MDNRYNLDNLEALFKEYLIAGIEKTKINIDKTKKKALKKVSIKNYLSDLRHFLGWLIFYLRSHNQVSLIPSGDELDREIEVIKKINLKIIESYRNYLWENKIPIKTINRRLSTLRKFFSFCLSQGWLNENPAKQIQNLRLKTKENQLNLEKEKILNQFKADLLKENIPQDKVISYLKDIEEFFTIV